jgi:hypothetical protein
MTNELFCRTAISHCTAGDGEIEKVRWAHRKKQLDLLEQREVAARGEAKLFTLLGFFILFTLRNLNELNSITQIKRRAGAEKAQRYSPALGR